MIEAVLERCAGIDVGKKYVVCCLSLGAANRTATEETRQYDTTGIARGSVESNDSRVIHSTTPFSPWQRLS